MARSATAHLPWAVDEGAQVQSLFYAPRRRQLFRLHSIKGCMLIPALYEKRKH